MSAKRIKKQHFVAQGYLRNFANEKDRLYVYDKVEDRLISLTGVHNVAAETNFHEYSATMDSTIAQNYQAIEKGLSKIESSAIRQINVLIKRAVQSPTGPVILPAAVRRDMACYIALQNLRTKESREYIREHLEKLGTIMMQAQASITFPYIDVKNYSIKFNEDYIKYQHMLMMFEFARDFTPIFEQKLWLFGVNTEANLWTSDHPVVRDAPPSDSIIPNTGLGSPEVVLFFPLSPHVVLLIYDRCGRPDLLDKDGKVVEINEEGISAINLLHVRQCYRQIFSLLPDLQVAKELCDRYPKLREYNRERLALSGAFCD